MDQMLSDVKIWDALLDEVNKQVSARSLASGLMVDVVLDSASFSQALGKRLAQKLGDNFLPVAALEQQIAKIYAAAPEIVTAGLADIEATYERDPACQYYFQPLLFFKGYLAVQAQRVAHWIWQNAHAPDAYYIQSRMAEQFGVDIHPGAKIGSGIMIDHAHSIVIGETAKVGNNVSLLHSVTLGGTGKEGGDRHPKIGDGVLIGAGAKVLGNISVGRCSRIAAGSVVLADVPECKTVAGIPAKIVGESGCPEPASSMNHQFDT